MFALETPERLTKGNTGDQRDVDNIQGDIASSGLLAFYYNNSCNCKGARGEFWPQIEGRDTAFLDFFLLVNFEFALVKSEQIF